MAITRTGAAAEHEEKARLHYCNAFTAGKDEFVKAIAEYSEVIKLLPNDAESYNFRASCYHSLEQDEKALDDLNMAISLEPQNDDHYYSRALLYVNLGENEKGDADLEKAVELNPKKAGEYYYSFGNRIKACTGNKKEAAVYYKKSVEHGDDNGEAKAQLDEWGM